MKHVTEVDSVASNFHGDLSEYDELVRQMLCKQILISFWILIKNSEFDKNEEDKKIS